MSSERPEIPENDEVSGASGAPEPTEAVEVSRGRGRPEAGRLSEVAETSGVSEPAKTAQSAESPATAGPPGAGKAAQGPEAEAPEAAEAIEAIEATGTAEAAEALQAPQAPRGPEAAKAAEAPRAAGAAGVAGAGTSGAPEGSEVADTPHVTDVSQAPEGAGDGGAAREGRAARRRSRAVVLSVAAAVLLVGGGGAYLATGHAADGRAGAGTSGAGATPPPLVLDGAAGGGTGGEIAPGEPDPYGATYVAAGNLPEGPGSAPVYAPKGEVGKDRVARLAAALGMDGAPVADGGGWRVGDADGSGPTLRVSRDAPGSWTYSRWAPGTDNCRKVTVCAQDPADPAGDPVSAAAARRAAAPVLKALGQDDAKIDASRIMGARRVVDADPVVGGLPTYGWTTGLIVDERGVLVGGHGMLATPAEDDTYPVLDARRTLALMNAAHTSGGHRMGIGGCATPVPLKDRLEQPCSGSGSGAAGKADALPVRKAVFGLAAHTVAGRQALVPSWLFEVRGPAERGTFTVTYPAVDPEFVKTPSSSAPSTRPSSAPRTHDVRPDGYTADGRELTVSFSGGVCTAYSASARESAGRVTVTVTGRDRPDQVCVAMARQYVKTVRLDAPLGAREVTGTDGTPVPRTKPGALRPQAG
ncbi:hypothetical protein [Streptomyces collinus]|uniref:hypothetical protein n=1 Tax=Streptomyces collinus TaxID=42684 RepID=UPI002942AFDE|nr:hypothetical protein [Streptomyces collinus]